MRPGIRLLTILSVVMLSWGPGAWATDELAGTDVVRAKDIRAQTLQIGENVYRVTSQTAIRDANGRSLSLADVDVPAVPEDGPVPLASVRVGQYRAARQGDMLVLRSLDLIPIPQ